MSAFIEAALNACKEVDTLIKTNIDEEAYALQSRGAGGDISIGFDLMAESVFIKYLEGFGAISSEESGLIGDGKDLIVIDPIDGSDNIKSRFPYYGTSIALQTDGETVAAIVCNFANGDCFIRYDILADSAAFGVEPKKEEILIHSYSKVGIFEKAVLHPEESMALIRSGLKFRSPGAIALSLAYAHYVNYVVFFGTMRPYDLDAGFFLCEGLFRYRDDELLIVSKDQTVFNTLLKIFKRGNSEPS